MAHEIVCDSELRSFGDMIEIDDADTEPLFRFHRRVGGDAVMIVSAEALCDGRPLLGNLARVDWGASALLRVGRKRIEIRWRAAGARRAVDAQVRCRVCFGTFAPGELAAGCACDVMFHDECDRARLNCPGCGAPREEGSE